MTDLFRVRVEAVEGPFLTLDVDHVYGWHWDNDLVTSLTLSLHFLWEPLLGYIRHDIPFPDGRRITWEEADALAPTLPLGGELDGRDSTDEAWNRANVGRFIACVGVTDRRHHNEMWNGMNDPRWHFPRDVDRSELEEAKARYRIAATDPRWLAHLAPGMEWQSTAYDHDEKTVVDPTWRTPTVLGLARQMDESGDLSALPILADALEEAGCADERLLAHCRGPGPHVRGCWALDRLLGGGLDPRVIQPAAVSRVEVELWSMDLPDGQAPPVIGTDAREDIAAVLAAVRPAEDRDTEPDWERGVLRFIRHGTDPVELLFFPGPDEGRYEFRTAGRVYSVGRAAFAAALNGIGVALPLN